MGRVDSLEKTLTLGKAEGKKGAAEDEMVGWHHCSQWTWVWASSETQWRTGKPGVLQSMEPQGVRHELVMKQQQSIKYLPILSSAPWTLFTMDMETDKCEYSYQCKYITQQMLWEIKALSVIGCKGTPFGVKQEVVSVRKCHLAWNLKNKPSHNVSQMLFQGRKNLNIENT